MTRWFATAVVCAALLVTEAAAQTPTPEGTDFFHAESEALDRMLTAPPLPELGADSEYDGIPAVDPMATTWDPEPEYVPLTEPADGALSFDPLALRNLPFGLERVDDPALLYFLEFYATEGRRRMSNWLARAGRYRAALEPILTEAEVPEELFWVIAAESGFDPTIESHAGAVGLWQFMSRTARSYDLRVDRYVDERCDPVAATHAAAAYFGDLYDTFGSWPLSLAAYNAGHGHVRGELRTWNLTDFWELDEYEAIFSNSRRYALRVMTIAIIDRNRAAFGYDTIVPDELLEFDTVDVPGNVRLSLLGEAVDLNAAEIGDLNPALVGLRTPPDAESWPLHVPVGTADTFVANYDRLRSRYGDEHEAVVLRFGETVEDVAEAYGIPNRVLRSINDIAYDAPSPYGSEILVPSRRRDPAPDEAAEPIQVIVPQTRFAFADRQRIFYRTRPGDTLNRVATHFEVDPQHLAAWNDLDADAALVSELVLQVFVAPDMDLSDTVYLSEEQVSAIALNSPEWIAAREAEEAEAAARRRYYTVRRGDTVMEIAGRFGVRSADIIRWNELGDEAMIVVGQRLVVGR